MKIKAIITGATGMVGEGVLHEALQHPDVEEVLVISRKPCGVNHSKLKEIIHSDFYDISPIVGQLSGYNTCYFCLGVSSVGMKEPEYFKLTHTLTLNFAEKLSSVNPEMTFCYISGSATDSTEQGKSMWARVKGKTENDLMKLPFKAVYNFRPAFMLPTKGLKNTLSYYKYISWMYPLGHRLFPDYFSTLAELGLAMIHTSIKGYSKQIFEVRDILVMSK
ncbi:NAD-dependent epimerase/dehydratase family protein [Emticicia sp. SJ17W-69]|uniref:NAD-dependent epimerase/dehydratase family protein n=1 Tax=Emticicia sp. SJ17W-69 TaxID=3421657 RepID=UPI003EBE0D98